MDAPAATLLASFVSSSVAIGIALAGNRRARRQDRGNRRRLAVERAASSSLLREERDHAERLQHQQQEHAAQQAADQRAHVERLVAQLSQATLAAEAERQKREAYTAVLAAAHGMVQSTWSIERAHALIQSADLAEPLASAAVREALVPFRVLALYVLGTSKQDISDYAPRVVNPYDVGSAAAREALPEQLDALGRAIALDTLGAVSRATVQQGSATTGSRPPGDVYGLPGGGPYDPAPGEGLYPRDGGGVQ